MRARYVWRDGEFIERKTGEPLNTGADRIASPMLMRDVIYKSPLSLKEVTSRSQRREEMKQVAQQEHAFKMHSMSEQAQFDRQERVANAQHEDERRGAEIVFLKQRQAAKPQANGAAND